MTTTINAVSGTGLTQSSDGSGVLKVQSNGVTTNALAWVNFAGSTVTKNASYNVSSVTRVGTGYYTVNFANSLLDSNYVSTFNWLGTPGNLNSGYESGSRSTSSVSFSVNASGTAFDPSYVNVSIFGN